MHAFEFKACRYLLTDIDDTLTIEGRLESRVLAALETIAAKGIRIIPITGRPAGYCHGLLAQWPIAAIIAENGCVAYLKDKQHKLISWYWQHQDDIVREQERLKIIAEQVMQTYPWVQVTEDQFMRIGDLCFDHAEHVHPWTEEQKSTIKNYIENLGASVVVSSIHVHSALSKRNKWAMAERVLSNHFVLNHQEIQTQCVFIGDSLNDASMFEHLSHTVGVANVAKYLPHLPKAPRHITQACAGEGFLEFANQLLTHV